MESNMMEFLQWGSLSLFEQSDSSHDIRKLRESVQPDVFRIRKKERSELKKH